VTGSLVRTKFPNRVIDRRHRRFIGQWRNGPLSG
jgi:hypothetical protein